MNAYDDIDGALVSRAAYLSLERISGEPFLSIPVSNRMVDHSEEYRLTEGQFEAFRADFESALDFANECRDRLHDDLLRLQPGSDRGVPCDPRR